MNHESLVATLRSEMEGLMDQLDPVLRDALARTDERMALPPGAAAALEGLEDRLPEEGNGAEEALRELFALDAAAGANTSGPRCFHFVIGGSTPAGLGADLLAAVRDTVTYTWVLSPVGVALEIQALRWLCDLLGLPRKWAGVMVTGASMANFTCLAAARQWWGENHGVDVAQHGLAGLPPMPVHSSGYVHASSRKVLGMLGVGRDRLAVHAQDELGRVDLGSLRRGLEATDSPAIVIVNAGEVNAGAFDPVEEMIDVARQFDTWVHVDGAFGLFAAVSPRTAHLVRGVERADSVTVDGHKWLNVPYDSGFAFARDHDLLARAFRYTADYLPSPKDPRPTLGAIGPESSRRARSFAVWATLRAYGRKGYRHIVEHSLDMAQHLARRIDESPDLERLAEVTLNIVPFRYDPGGLDDEALDDLNTRIGEAVLADGRFLVGTSKLGPRTIFRPAFSNWRTRTTDVDEFVSVVQELGQRARRKL